MKKKFFYTLTILLFVSLLTSAQTTGFWGMTSGGGAYNGGCIFKTDTSGMNQSVVYSFFKYDGSTPVYTQLLETEDGKLYGMTQMGGPYNKGVLFEYDLTADDYNIKLTFDGGSMGRNPTASLIMADDGKMYGMTYAGGMSEKGVIFSYDPEAELYTRLFNFDGSNSGGHPYGSLVQADNGKMYGMTSEGGVYDFGVLFEFDPATETYTKIIDFDGSGNGESPMGALTEAGNGKLYGTTFRGGASGKGVLFSFDPDTYAFTKVYDFTASEGSNPRNLIQAENGKIYGMTAAGGSANLGVIYEFDPATDTYTKKQDLDYNTGGYPRGSLLQASDGKLYGLTYTGGANNDGTIISYDIDTDVLTKLMDFDYWVKGKNPMNVMTEASNGKLYGLTYRGGPGNSGVLFEYQPGSGDYNILVAFNKATEGKMPYGDLIQAGNKKLYGMTGEGGSYDFGVVFGYDPMNETYEVIHNFDGAGNGGYPFGSLTQAENGLLYGMTPEFGTEYYGILFSIDPETGTFEKKLDFDGDITGAYPYGSLLPASDGMLYGMAYDGGAYASGVIFRFDPLTDTYTVLFDFDNENTGGHPEGSLIQADNGKMYGLTTNGGTHSNGTLFEFDPVTNIYANKYNFGSQEDDGILPMGSLEEAPNGKLYGMTYRGGVNNAGTIFEFDPTTGIYTKTADFEYVATGSDPYGSLLATNGGKLLGMTLTGGAHNFGVLFSYDPLTNVITKTLDFDADNGSSPYGSLTEVSLIVNNIKEPPFAKEINIYPVPTDGKVYLELGSDYSNMQILVRAADGRLVHNYGVAENERISLRIDEPAGVYFIEIINHDVKAVYKVIKR